eukprot:1860836-Pyramimonas_sp.AAC.1
MSSPASSSSGTASWPPSLSSWRPHWTKEDSSATPSGEQAVFSSGQAGTPSSWAGGLLSAWCSSFCA